MYLGLTMASRDHILTLIVESVSKIQNDIITYNSNLREKVPILVWCTLNILSLNWNVLVYHTGYKGNGSVD